MTAGDYGQVLLLNVQEDLSTLPTVWVVLERPDDSSVIRTPATGVAVTTPTKPAVVSYTVQAGDLTIPGVYEAQVFVQFTGAGARGVASEPVSFMVTAPLRTAPWVVPPVGP
jgi:hypothetical protein